MTWSISDGGGWAHLYRHPCRVVQNTLTFENLRFRTLFSHYLESFLGVNNWVPLKM